MKTGPAYTYDITGCVVLQGGDRVKGCMVGQGVCVDKVCDGRAKRSGVRFYSRVERLG